MDYDKLAALALAFPILAAATTPGVAKACPGYYDPCQDLSFWQDLTAVNAAKIPSDGVLVLQGNHQGDDAASLPSIEMTVTKDGQPLAGALEATSVHGVLVWRPSEPWDAGTSYAMSATITNSLEGDSPDAESCAPLMISIEDTLNIDVAPGAALGPVEFSGESELEVSPQVSLDTLACCEGAKPSLGYSDCDGSALYWNPSECAPTQAYGILTVTVTGQPAATGPVAAQVVYAINVNGGLHASGLSPQFSVNGAEPFCAVIEATDLASGAVTKSQKQCFGEAVADQLGLQMIDPSEKLTCALEMCAPNGAVWDPMTCTPVGPSTPTTSDSDDPASDSASESSGSGSDTAGEGEGDAGCGCDARPTGDAGLLALVGVVGLLGRRKRARRGRD